MKEKACCENCYFSSKKNQGGPLLCNLNPPSPIYDYEVYKVRFMRPEVKGTDICSHYRRGIRYMTMDARREN